jgi:hypothetical protein
MAIRSEVRELVQLGPFPASHDADEQDIDRRGAALNKIRPPVSDEEAAVLLPLVRAAGFTSTATGVRANDLMASGGMGARQTRAYHRRRIVAEFNFSGTRA